MTFEFIRLTNHIMILAAIFAVPVFHGQIGQATETKLFTVQKGKVVPGSIRLSPDLNHFSYMTNDKRIVLDGKLFGPYLTNGSAVYSGDSKTCAFLAQVKPNEESKLFWNGEEKRTDFPVASIFVSGETGPIAWVERKRTVEKKLEEGKEKDVMLEFSRLVTPEETTDWFEKIEKLGFSEDGKLFYMRVSEKIVKDKDAPIDNSAPSTKDYVVYRGGKKVARGNILQVFAAPNGEGFSALTSLNEMVSRKQTTRFNGEIYGKPVFSPDGKQMAFRIQFTGYSSEGNKPYYHYYVDGQHITDFQIQSGLTYSPDSSKWVMCGFNGKEAYLYSSNGGKVSFADAGLGGAPIEPYRAGAYVNDKMVFLFQPKRSKPLLFVEGKGLVELGPFISSPETFSVSPDGKRLLIAGSAGQETRAYMVDLEHPVAAVDVLKGMYDLQNLGKGTFVWNSTREAQFAVLRKNDLVRVKVAF